MGKKAFMLSSKRSFVDANIGSLVEGLLTVPTK